MQSDAYGIFCCPMRRAVVQYWMLDLDWPAIVKRWWRFVATMALDWIATRLLGKFRDRSGYCERTTSQHEKRHLAKVQISRH